MTGDCGGLLELAELEARYDPVVDPEQGRPEICLDYNAENGSSE